ncbi:MAG: peroxiredoxin [Omnitrophica WOR_2 bacterium RIFCSPHIGHO2_02_FULL_68_15]|nr:MAG: peroxiredoxin [Omnitrophica WOR_2 bacterium RIFCSPHIGHO2_02_FULL_68_15]
MAVRALQAGDAAPTFALQTAEGRTVRLSDFRGATVVLYFYPKDDTPGCTKEACGFRDARARFAKANAVVLGISGDSVASHQRFAGKYGLTFPLLSDPEHAVATAYGVYKQKSMYGRTYWGIERTTFIVDPQGRIAAVFPKVSVDGHVEAILQAVQGSTARRVHISA